MIGGVISHPIEPMLAIPGEMPPPADQRLWSYEMKWDGVRAIAVIRDGQLRLWARSGRDITASYPELQPLAAALQGRNVVLDGEVVAFDDTGRVSFAALQPRIHGTLKSGARPVAYLLFDLLEVGETTLFDKPYAQRRRALDALGLNGPNWQTPPVFEGNGAEAKQASVAHGLEGVVAKRLDARYEPGTRSGQWLKVKNILTQEVVVGGWRTGKDSRLPTFGSLLCGVNDDDGLSYIGRVGSGFDGETLRILRARLDELARKDSPFSDTNPVPPTDTRDAHWVDPVLVGEVVFAGWTPDRRLWHPRWRGLRADKSPEEVVRES